MVLNIGLMVVTYLFLTALIIDHTRYSGGFFHNKNKQIQACRKDKPCDQSRVFIESVLSDWLGDVRHFIKHKGFNTTFSRSHVLGDVLAR